MTADDHEVPVLVEPEPAVAAQIAGTAAPVLRRYVADLVTYGEQLGLLGPREYPRIWSRHVLNCAVIAPLFNGLNTVADVGSGAGLPGLVLAAMRPDIEWHLIESMERRARWLVQECDRLELGNVIVHTARAEELAADLTVDGATARAVSALRSLVPWTAPLVRSGGRLVLIKGRSAADELSLAAKQLRRYGVVDARVEHVGDGLLAEPTTVVIATVKG